MHILEIALKVLDGLAVVYFLFVTIVGPAVFSTLDFPPKKRQGPGSPGGFDENHL